MSRLIPLILLALAACDATMERTLPRETLFFESEGTTYRVRVQYDPIAYSWFTRVWSPHRDLTPEDRDAVVALVENQVGPAICAGRPLAVDEGPVWNPLAGGKQMLLEYQGTWQLVGKCA